MCASGLAWCNVRRRKFAGNCQIHWLTLGERMPSDEQGDSGRVLSKAIEGDFDQLIRLLERALNDHKLHAGSSAEIDRLTRAKEAAEYGLSLVRKTPN